MAPGSQPPQGDAVQQTNHCSQSDGPRPVKGMDGQGEGGQHARHSVSNLPASTDNA
ncbi:hypothetical protein GCM10018790_72850 [Kitasatospora xanthocidica]|nr:hypothetical protein GCM10018790_72850 [Kitasatospora xanthocidica]